MLVEGTKTMNSDEIADFFDTFAGEVETNIWFEYFQVSLTCPKKHFLKVLPVFRSLLTEAVFPEAELEKLKRQKSIGISVNCAKTSYWANQLYKREMFGENHPFGQISLPEDAEAITREDVVKYYENYLWNKPQAFLTGNVGNQELDMIGTLLGDLPVCAVKPFEGKFLNRPKRRIFEERKDSLQSTIRLGCHVIPSTHPDHFPFWVMNTLLGGFFGSRLSKNIREDKGHTYGIYSTIGSLAQSDYWMVAADVIKKHKEDVFTEIYREIERIKYEPIPAEELETLRNYMAGKLLSQFNSSFEMISRFRSVHLSGQDLSFYQQQLDFILNFTENDIHLAAQKYLDMDHCVEILVG
jgi:predicted Zn-dependent peptidase